MAIQREAGPSQPQPADTRITESAGGITYLRPRTAEAAGAAIPIPVPSRTNWPFRGALAALVGVLGTTGYIAFAHDRGPSAPPADNGKASDSFKPGPDQPGIVINPAPITPNIAEVPTNSGTTPPKEAPTPPEVKKELAPCLITSPELCAKAERIERPNARGDIVTYIGLKVLPGTEIFSPIDGQVAKVEISQGASLHGFRASIDDLKPNSTSFSVTGDLIFPNRLSLDEKKGALIGIVGDRGIQNLGDFNVVVSAGRFDANKSYAVSDVDTLKKMFPKAFEKPAKRVENMGNGQYFGGNVYLGGR